MAFHCVYLCDNLLSLPDKKKYGYAGALSILVNIESNMVPKFLEKDELMLSTPLNGQDKFNQWICKK